MNGKTFLKSFFIALLLTKVIATCIISSQDHEISFLGYFIILTFNWTPVAIVTHIFMFGIYFLLINAFITKIKDKVKLYISMVALAVIYLALSTATDWSFSQHFFTNFRDYFYEGSCYLVYALINVIVLTIIGLRTFWADEEALRTWIYNGCKTSSV